jgi:hypothetical protein
MMKKEIPIYILLSAILVMLVLVFRELQTLRNVSAAMKQQMDTPQGMRPSRAGGGIPVYVTDGPPMPTR